MVGAWEGLIESTGIPLKGVKKVWKEWIGEDDEAKLQQLLNFLSKRDALWPITLDPADRLLLGVYTPIQLLIWQSGKAYKQATEYEYPFLFSILGLVTQTLLDGFQPPEPEEAWPERAKDGAESYRKLAQSIFQLREMREEREPLSLEVNLPLEESGEIPLSIGRLARLFGRGVGVSRGFDLSDRKSPKGIVQKVFKNHETAPLSSLYTLAEPYPRVGEARLSLVLRRDGHLTLASQQNPILEFYDGGWHVVDLESGQAALSTLFDEYFVDNSVPVNLAEKALMLAYHLSTHWHGAILAFMDLDQLKRAEKDDLEGNTKESERTTKSVLAALEEFGGSASITDVEKSGMGRLLLSLAIQDGAVIFDSSGIFQSAGRIVKRGPDEPVEGGSRHHAAKSLSKHGVVIAVSQDGAIKLYSGGNGGRGLEIDGLRIH